MKRILFIAALVFAAASVTLGQPPTQTPEKPATQEKPAAPTKPVGEKTAAAGSVEQAIMQFESERREATLRNDPAYFERVLADDYMGTGMNGEVTDKAQTIANTKAGNPKFESLTYEDQKVRVYGDAAVVTGRALLKGTTQGQAIDGPVRFTRVYVKRGDKWQLVTFQVTRVAQAPAK